MKTIFIPVKSKLILDESKINEISKQLPKQLAIGYSIQYKDSAAKIKLLLSKKHKITKLIQVLGCSKPEFPKDTQALLIISDGKFHATSLAYETKLPVYLFNMNNLEKISRQDIEILERKEKTSYLKFLHAEKIGILISTKPGQQNMKKALGLAKKFKNKLFYNFISNQVDTNEFENFGLNSWVNTACPRLDIDNNSIINISKLKD